MRGGPAVAGAAAVGLVGLAGLVAGGFARPDEAAAAYLAALMGWSALPFGALAILLILRLTGGGWTAALTGPLTDAGRTLLPTALLFAPLMLALPLAFPWVGEGEGVWLNRPFFIARTAAYLILWVALYAWLVRSAGTAPAKLGVILYALTASLAGVDWLLSRDPSFNSSLFGVMVILHHIVAAYAFALLAAPLGRAGAPARAALGGLLQAGVLGWGVVAYLHYLVVWTADLPHEAAWYLDRFAHGWDWAWTLVIALNGVVPFFVLLYGPARRNVAVLKVLAAGILGARLIEAAWLTLPAERLDPVSLPLMLAAVAALGGVWTSAFLLMRRA